MRTTIELKENQRAELLRLAGKRKLKGFSLIIQDAIDQYIRSEKERARKTKAALAMKGSLKADGEDFAERVLHLRDKWR